MKKILIVITKLLRQASIGFIIINIHILSAKAQQDYLYAEKADSLFANLDKSLITTGILYDRAFPLSRALSFETAPHGGRRQSFPCR